MRAKLIMMALVAIFVVACAQEAPPPPPAPVAPVAPQPVAQPVAQAPAAPTIVYASAEPQHGGVRQKVGDYMVELATGAEGKVNAYVQKYEGDVPSFEDVQVEMQVKPEEAEAKAEAEEEDTHDVIFYPKDGKLEGTVAGLPKGAYDIAVRIFDIKDDKMVEHKFEKVELTPLETELQPKHDGEVQVIDKTKMEVVREGSRIKVWLRDLEDKKLKPAEAAIKQAVVNLEDGTKEELEIEPKDDHFEAEVKGKFNPEQFKILMAQLVVADEEYPKLRVPRVIPKVVKKGLKPIVTAPVVVPPPMTKGTAKKKDKPGKMKGTIGTMSVGKPPRVMAPMGGKKKGKKPGGGPAGNKAASKKTKKGAVSKAKKAQ